MSSSHMVRSAANRRGACRDEIQKSKITVDENIMQHLFLHLFHCLQKIRLHRKESVNILSKVVQMFKYSTKCYIIKSNVIRDAY